MSNEFDLVMVTAVKEYLRLEGAPYNDNQLAKLWAEQKIGEFGFRLLARIGIFGVGEMARRMREGTSFEQSGKRITEYIDATLHGIEKETYAFKSTYRNIDFDFLPTMQGVTPNYGGYMFGSSVALLPYALPVMGKVDLADVLEKMQLGFNGEPVVAKAFLETLQECDVQDYPLFIKPLLHDTLEDLIMAQVTGIVSNLIDMNMTEQIWWNDIVEQVEAIQKQMCAEAEQRVQKYRLSGRDKAAYFFAAYAEDDTQSALEYAKQKGDALGVEADMGIVRMQTILTSNSFARPEGCITDLFKLLDMATDIFTGACNPGYVEKQGAK